MAEKTPAQISEEIFNLYVAQYDEGLGRLSAATIVRFVIEGLSLRGNIQAEVVINAITMLDPTGTLDLREFRIFLMVLDGVLRKNGYGGYVTITKMKQILGYGPREPVQEVVVPVIPQQIQLATRIPGTAYTYQQLADAFVLRPGAVAGVCAAGRYMGVHEAMRNLANPQEGIQILAAVAARHPNGRDAPRVWDIYIPKMRTYLSRSTNPDFRAPGRIDIFLRGIKEAVENVMDNVMNVGELQVPTGYMIFGPILFMDTLNAYPAIQTTFAENVVTQNIEAYRDEGVTLGTYQLGQHISCPNGVFERHLMELSTALTLNAGARVPGPGAPRVPAPPRDVDIYNPPERKRLYDTWLQRYVQSGVPVSVDGFKAFVREKIPTLDPPNNNPANWPPEELDAYVAEEGTQYTLTGGGKRRRRTYRKRKSTRAKRLH